MNRIQSFDVDGWGLLDTTLGEGIILSYLEQDSNIVIRMRANLILSDFERTVDSVLTKLRSDVSTVHRADGTFYVNGLLWNIYTDELVSGSYRSYLFTEYMKHCIYACVDISNDSALVVYQRDLRVLLRSVSLVCLLDENATLEIDDVSVTVYSQSDVTVNENSNADALFFLNDERYVVIYATDAPELSFNDRAEKFAHTMFDERCKITNLMLRDNYAIFEICSRGSVNYCTYAETEVSDGESKVKLSVVSHDHLCRKDDLVSEFRFEVMQHAV